MTKSESHKRAQQRAAGTSGRIEVALPGGQRLDAETKTTATEVERSGNTQRLKQAARRLLAAKKPQNVLQVPQHHMAQAAEAMRDVGASGTVKNMNGTKRRTVRKK